jgi:hypothetical protein
VVNDFQCVADPRAVYLHIILCGLVVKLELLEVCIERVDLPLGQHLEGAPWVLSLVSGHAVD